jgi:hypothetical protein
MANQNFDTVIVNPLERPVSQDLDAAQSELNRTLRDVLVPVLGFGTTAIAADGFLAAGFRPTEDLSVGLGVVLKAGTGFQFTSDSQVNIDAGAGAVSGLNDLSRYKPLVLSADKKVLCAPAPAAGLCRRDLIQVRWDRSYANEIRDVLNTSTYVFTGQSIPKTMTFDLSSVSPEIVAVGSTATAAIAVKTGQTVAYSTEDSFLSAPIPAADAGYITVAVLNVGPAAGSISANRIVDNRTLLLPSGNATASALVATTEAQPSFAATTKRQFPVGANVVVAGIVGQQELWCWVLLGDASKWEAVGESWSYLGNGSAGPTVNVLPQPPSLVTLTKAEQDILSGADAAFMVDVPATVAVGQKAWFFSVKYGRETYQFSDDINHNGIAGDNVTINFPTNNFNSGSSNATGTGIGIAGGGSGDLIYDPSFPNPSTTGGLVKSINMTKLDSTATRRISGTLTLQRI